MRFVYTVILLSMSIAMFAQDDEIPTYRSKRENFLKMTEKDLRADLATFTLGGLDEAAGKDPIPYIPVVSFSSDSVLLQKDNMRVIIKAGTFDKTKHKILLYDEKYVTKIDNKPFYGIIGKMPVTTIQSVQLIIGRDTVVIPPAAYADLYNPAFCKAGSNAKTKCNTGAYISKDGHRIYIYMLNGDGKEGYEVTWVIQDKLYLRRVVDWDF